MGPMNTSTHLEAGHAHVHVRLPAGELELSGDPEFVESYREQISSALSILLSAPSDTQEGSPLFNPDEAAGGNTFGEFFATFPKKMTDVDRMLAAAHFAQAQDPARA